MVNLDRRQGREDAIRSTVAQLPHQETKCARSAWEGDGVKPIRLRLLPVLWRRSRGILLGFLSSHLLVAQLHADSPQEQWLQNASGGSWFGSDSREQATQELGHNYFSAYLNHHLGAGRAAPII